MKASFFRLSPRSGRCRLFTRYICIILVVFLLSGINAYAVPESTEDENNLEYLKSVMNMISDEYWGARDDSSMLENAVRGMFGSLDNYTTYFDKEEAEKFFTNISGVFGGIGVLMEKNGDYIAVTEVYSDSPAEKAGILQGDKIVEADGVSLVKVSVEEAASIIRGKEGTKVNLGILRNGSDDIKYIEVVREVVKLNPVIYEFRDGIGYIRIEEFNESTDEYLTKALEDMDRKKTKKIVLDLRDNPGGDVSQAVDVASKFVPKGLVTKLDYKSEKYTDTEYYSYLEKTKYKLAVLVNGQSASASEIVAGAVQDSGVGKLVGTRTYGKAKFQGMIPILTPEAFNKYRKELGLGSVNVYDLQRYYGIIPKDDEIAGYAKMTLGLYYTPKGRMIDGKGLEPDIEVADPLPVEDIKVNNIGKLTKTTEPMLNSIGIDVYNAECILKILGYKKGNPDTHFDSDTLKAVKAYQKESGIEVTGKLDSRTQSALNRSRLEIIKKFDTQYIEAVKLLN